MKASKHQLKRLGRRGLSLLMAMTMCLSLIQISAFATADPNVVTQATNQITNGLDGGTVYYTGTGTAGNSGNWAVQLSRTLEATGTENLFNVNMEVVTKDGEIEVTNSSAAVTLVLDTSGSMAYCAECGGHDSHDVTCSYYGTNDNRVTSDQSRLAAAKAALVSFLNSYAKDGNGNFYSSARMVSLVTFSGSALNWDLSSASGDQYWVNVNNQDALDYIINNVINGTETYGKHDSKTRDKIRANGFTNTDDGMSTAADLLNTTTYSSAIGSIDNRFCVLLTDGQPTTCNYPDGWWDLSYPETYYAQLSCADVTGTTAALYSIAYGLSGDIVQVEGVGDVYITETDGSGVVTGGWLKDQCGSTAVYNANSSADLITAFRSILTEANQSTTSTNGVTASIGQLLGESAHAYTFIGFNDDNGLVLNGTTPSTSYNGASVTADSLEWDLAAASSVRDEGAKTTTYSLSYQVRLNNNETDFLDWTASSHAAAAEYSVGSASLTYQYTPVSGTPSTPEVAFPDVKAHGYLAEFNFMKIAHHRGVDSQNNPVIIPLAGAPFQLTNLANAPLYVQASAITQNTTSQADVENETLGQVEFTGIPSGYAYTLSETAGFTYNGRPYQPINTPWNVSVSYGEISGAPSGNVENTLDPLPETKTLTKTWNLAPGSNTQAITVYLYQNDSNSPFATLTLNGDDYDDGNNPDISITPIQITGTQWQYQLTVPSVDQETGGNYSYRIAEESLGDGIESVVDGMNITNTTTGTTSVSVEKKWALIDGQDPSASMPDVTVYLTRTSTTVPNGEAVGSVTLGAGENESWNYEWNNLPAYDDNGQPYTYAVTEGQGNYQDIKVVKDGNQFTLYNHVLEGETTKTITKTWNDENPNDRPDITVELLRDDDTPYFYTMSADDDTGGTVISSDGNTWSHTFTGLPQYQIMEDDNQPSGVSVHEYVYTVAELTDVPGYTSTTSGDLGLINTRAQDVTIQVTKTWDDKNYVFDHGEVVIDLLRSGTKIAEQNTVDGTATFDEINGEPLPQFDPATGEAYDYTVLEENVPAGYVDSYNYGIDKTVVVFDDDSHIGTVTVTNTLTTKDNEKTSVHVSKVWQQPSGTTAPKVTFTLEQLDKDGNSVNLNYASYEMTSGSSYTFANLPMYYYEQVPETHTDPETNEPTTETVVKEYTYQYSVSESAVEGYNNGQPAMPDKIADNDWQFTNTRTGTVDLTVNKVWNDIDNSTRSDATITLQRASAVESGALTFENVPGADPLVTRGDDSKSWTVDQFDSAGQPYTYRVVENTVSSYSTTYTADTYSDTVQSITVTNTLMPVHNYSFNASKTWMDNGNAANTREGITLTLLRNNEAQGTVVIDANGTLGAGTYTGKVSVTPDPLNSNKWNISFTDLEKYYIDSSDGKVKQYTYSVAETLQPDSAYVQNNGSTDIVNTLKQIGISIPLHKVWVDPETTEHTNSVTFSLTATNAGGQTVTSVDGSSLPTGVTLGFNPGDTFPQNIEGTDLTTDDLTIDNWYYTFTDLPQYDDNQSKITYTVAETTNLDGYTKKTEANNLFTNTIEQEYLDFDGQKIWDMQTNQNEGDYLTPGPQPVTIGLYEADAQGNPISTGLVNLGDNNPVIVSPVTGEDSITGTFSFKNLPRYDLNGSELHYTVREIEVTTSAETGEPGYCPIADGGTLQLTVSDHNTPFHYNYTVGYTESPKTPAEDENNGTDTTVLNTYQDPNYYFYRIIGNYYTYNTSANNLIAQDENVNLTPDDAAYIALTPEQLAELSSNTITADPDSYTSHGGVDFVFDSGDQANELSVTLSVVNHMYTIELNYVRHLYTLSVNYVFPTGDKPDTGFADYTDPNWTAPGEGETYTDPGKYLGNAAYTDTLKAAPTGFQITKVTVKNSDADASTINDLTYNGGNFDNHDVIVTYYYNRVINPVTDVTNPSFTIQKIDPEKIIPDDVNSLTDALITSSAADFQVYEDANCTMPVDGKVFSTVSGEKTIKASDLGVGEWYLQELNAPEGYAKSDTVWKAVVTRTESQVLEGSQYVNKVVWTVNITVNGEQTSALTGESSNILSVSNAREYGYLTITKTVTGLEKNESKEFKFTVSGNNYGTSYTNDSLTITVPGNDTKSLAEAIKVPTGTYVVTETSESASIPGYQVTTTNNSASVTVTTANTETSPANVTITNQYKYNTIPEHSKTITGTKVWNDDNNRDGLRPASIRLQLENNGTAISGVGTADVPTTGSQSYQFTYDNYMNDGTIMVKEIGYTDAQGVYHEGLVPGYEISSNGTDDNDYTVTNTHMPEMVIIQASKVWNSGTQQAVTLRLYANGTAVDNAVLVLDGIVDEDYTPEFTAWTGTFGTFYKYANGSLIDYSVTEDSLGSNWKCSISESALLEVEVGDVGYLFTATNSYSKSGGGDSDSYYYRTDYVYTGYGADGSQIYSDAVTGSVQTTGKSSHSFTSADTANHGGYSFSLASDADLSASLTGTSKSNPYVFTVYYEFTELEDDGTPTGETPDTGATPDEPIDIPGDEVPKADVPATGDNLALWIMAAAVSGIGLVWLSLTGKKRREDENS